MCTAATYKTDGFYFGRTLDYEFSYGDEIVVTPRRFPLAFSGGKALSEHFALLGMAHVADGYPLYYDAMNEKGLCMAGLNFVGNAAYAAPRGGEGDVAQFEFIPWVLAQCASVSEARVLLGKTNLTGTPFSAALPAAQLHWLLADKDDCVTIESTADGLHIYDNPAGVLTNNPPFPQQLFRNAVSGSSETESVSQFFHILGAVEQVRGCCEVAPGKHEITLYTSCCSAQRGIYYYTTYENRRISAVDMHRCDLDAAALARFAPRTVEDVFYQN